MSSCLRVKAGVLHGFATLYAEAIKTGHGVLAWLELQLVVRLIDLVRLPLAAYIVVANDLDVLCPLARSVRRGRGMGELCEGNSHTERCVIDRDHVVHVPRVVLCLAKC